MWPEKANLTQYRSYEELSQHSVQGLPDAVDVLERKAPQDEVEDFHRFVLMLVEKGPVRTSCEAW